MCGICGYWGLNLGPGGGMELLRTMNDQLTHRGPDSEGYYVAKRIGLAMRRLQVIDLNTGDQPMINEDHSIRLVFNGEIYNHHDLRLSLMKAGHQFRSGSDTEVIIHQYEQNGHDCVRQLNGMFAFALWDDANQTLVLARDRMGIKPLYYYWDGKVFLFASELKALLATPYVSRHIEWQSVWDYLTFRYVPAPATIWQHVYKLSPAHCIVLSRFDSTPQPRRYWDIPYSNAPRILSKHEALAEFETLFLDSISRRMVADVPVGVFLSGGLDSSAVTAAIREVHNPPLDSFTVGFRNSDKSDERAYAREVAKALGTRHHEIIIGQKEMLDMLPDLPYWTDEPLADLTAIPLYYLSRLARQHVTVVLSGEGSDEVLGGYDFDVKYRMLRWIHQWQRLPKPLRKAATWVPQLFGNAAIVHQLGLAGTSPLQLVSERWGHMTKLMTTADKQTLWKKRIRYTDSLKAASQALKRCKSTDPLHRLLFMYCQSWLVEDLLMKADKMSMANSLELRTPFLDHRLVEWAAKQSPAVKINRNGTGHYETKWILREFARTRLPHSILTRPKAGFPIPLYDWLSDRLIKWARYTLMSDRALLARWFTPQAIEHIVNRGTSLNAEIPDRHRLWNLLILELWMQRWKPTN